MKIFNHVLYTLCMVLCLSGKAYAAASTPSPREVAAQIALMRAQQADEGTRACAFTEQPVIHSARPATATDVAEIELLRATSIGDIEAVELIIKKGHNEHRLHNIDGAVSISRGPTVLLARYKLTNYAGMTPLMIAVSKAGEDACGKVYYKIIKILINNGADAFNIRAFGDRKMRTAYDFASSDATRAFIDKITKHEPTCH